ncbi:MAG: hypothetical protein AB8G23_11280 [Myxococcota bacterium]
MFLASAGANAQADDAVESESAKALSDLMAAEAEEDRLGWEYQFGFGFGVLTQSQDGNTTVPPNGPSFESRNFEDSGDSLISEFFDFNLQLYTPIQLDLPLKPRFLLTGAVQLPIAEDLVSNRLDTSFNRSGIDSDPVRFAESCPEFMTDDNGDPIISNRTGNPIEPDTCSTAIRNRTTPLALWSAGVGADFTLPFDEEQFHIVTTLDYVGMAVQGEGAYSRRTSSQQPEAIDPIIDSVDVIGDAETYHGLSTSIRLAIDAYEEDAFTWQVYVAGRASYFFANEQLESSGSTGQGNFDFVSELDGMQYQVFTGFSVRFNPNFR